MLNIHVERLKRLPQRPDETWQAGTFRLPSWYAESDGKPSRPWAGLCVSVATGLVHTSELRPAADKSPGMALEALAGLAANKKTGGYRPGRLEVREAELASYLASMLVHAGIEVVQAPELPALDAVLDDMTRHFLHGRDDPAALNVEGVTVEHLRSFAEAAKEFYDARPWRHLSDDDLIEVVSPPPEKGLGFATVMGAGRREFGLAFFESRREYERMIELDDPPRYFAKRSVWSLTFESITHLPLGDADAWEDHNLPVAGEDAYPLLARFGPKDSVRRPTASEWAFVEGFARALARTTEPEMDSGRWRKAVPTIAGSQEYVLALPALLEPIERPGPGTRRGKPGFPDRRAMERVLVDIGRATEGMEFSSPEELDRFLNANFTGKEVPHQAPRTPLEQAQDLAYEAVEAKGRRRIQLAHKALEMCPDCADAYVLLAEQRSEWQEARDLYAQGVAAGERALGPQFLADEVGHFWGLIETRPYMRARFGLAYCCEQLGQLDEATGHYEELLRLNPEDNQAVRYRLAGCLLRAGRSDQLEGVLRQYDDPSAHWRHLWALWAFRMEGDSPRARELLTAAHKENRHVRKYLLANAPLPDDQPDTYQPGHDSEAVIVAAELVDAWEATPGALEWLADVTKPTRTRRRRRERK
ncbi:MAG: tetratricopeptide repeat protein [Phycisphaerae bacterium]